MGKTFTPQLHKSHILQYPWQWFQREFWQDEPPRAGPKVECAWGMSGSWIVWMRRGGGLDNGGDTGAEDLE